MLIFYSACHLHASYEEEKEWNKRMRSDWEENKRKPSHSCQAKLVLLSVLAVAFVCISDFKNLYSENTCSTDARFPNPLGKGDVWLGLALLYMCVCSNGAALQLAVLLAARGAAPEARQAALGVPRLTEHQENQPLFFGLTKHSQWHFIVKTMLIFCHVAVEMSFTAEWEYRATIQPHATRETE